MKIDYSILVTKTTALRINKKKIRHKKQKSVFPLACTQSQFTWTHSN